MLSEEELARRAAAEERRGAVVVRAERVAANGDLVCDERVAGAARTAGGVVAVMTQLDGAGRPRIVPSCGTAPTVPGAVRRILTEMCVIDVTSEGLVVREVAAGISAVDVQERSGVPLLAGPDLRVIET